jgi:RNA polymerase sigma-70 factor (ECF subfamily)
VTAARPLRSQPDPARDQPPGGSSPAEEHARLLARAALGDEVAFAAFYDATASRTYGLVLRLVRNHAVAEEVTQEVYLQVWRTASRFDETRGNAMPWLLTVAHRRAVDRIRATEARSRLDTAYQQSNRTIDHDVTSDGALASLQASRVRAALESLSRHQREALELAYFGGRTHTEVAAVLGIPLGTAKTRIRDGLRRLRSLVDAPS